MKEIEQNYESRLRQMRVWNSRQSWSKHNLIKNIHVLLNSACLEEHEPIGTRFDEAVKQLRAIRTDGELSQIFSRMYKAIDKVIPDAEREMP
jgi:hypothetical protein